MSAIAVELGLNVRFPERDADFLEGVEIGLLLADLATAPSEIVRNISVGALPQANALASKFGYLSNHSSLDDSSAEFRCLRRGLKPWLRVVGGKSALA